MSVFDCLQPIRHFLDLFVDEFLADLRLLFHIKFFNVE